MNRILLTLALAAACAPAIAQESKPMPTAPEDPYLWLEDVGGDRALDWVRERNAVSKAELAASDDFKALESRIRGILDSDARIPFVGKIGEHYYNFWRDAKNPRGLWRRTSLAEYRKDEPQWDVVLDLDALGKAENENWVWRGADCLEPEYRRCLVSLSRGGADATVTREFDLVERAFVKDGFFLPEAKGGSSWRDIDTLYVGTDFGPGSMTASGYPRIAKLWRRGTPLSEATVVYEGKPEDIWISAFRDHTDGFERDIIYRGVTFFTNELYLLRDGKPVKVDKPDSANASMHREWLLLELRQDWTVGGKTHPAGALLATLLDDFLDGKREFDVLFAPTARKSLAGFSPTRNHILLNELDNVRNRVSVLTHGKDGWQREPLPGMPEFGTVGASAVDAEDSDAYFMTVTDYLTPTSLYVGEIGKGAPEKLKSLPAFFDKSGLEVAQREATSDDGTKVPYFIVSRKDLALDGDNPTLLYGYGGFEVPMVPGYSAGVGAAWLEKGGVYVVANIRGGGEFGPKWHQAALKANRNKAFEDFAAVAKDLIARKVTKPARLGTQGGSNGGLLMGNMLTTYPELFGAIVIQVPLLDMLRYHKLLAGASWVGEYGNPDDPEEAKFLRRYSAYHNLSKDKDYPPVLFTTSTRDDRVHPGHARKMMALMMEQGHDALYYENIEGGHGGAANNEQAAFMTALAYTFLWEKIGK
ncbi:MAG: prolyl oligopeptidase family serine peptidase [Xanthomonadaceae bacterium]|jgi:prolyl oligopeptidase|nr:prolyl oligopeptidase family serine peptidase [Xanthomonadaceae bacterium]